MQDSASVQPIGWVGAPKTCPNGHGACYCPGFCQRRTQPEQNPRGLGGLIPPRVPTDDARNKIRAAIVDTMNKEAAKEGTSPDPAVYYNGTETLEKMIAAFGKRAVRDWCHITAFKYLDRIGKKEGNSIEQEAKKASDYIKFANKLSKELDEEATNNLK